MSPSFSGSAPFAAFVCASASSLKRHRNTHEMKAGYDRRRPCWSLNGPLRLLVHLEFFALFRWWHGETRITSRDVSSRIHPKTSHAIFPAGSTAGFGSSQLLYSSSYSTFSDIFILLWLFFILPSHFSFISEVFVTRIYISGLPWLLSKRISATWKYWCLVPIWSFTPTNWHPTAGNTTCTLKTCSDAAADRWVFEAFQRRSQS